MKFLATLFLLLLSLLWYFIWFQYLSDLIPNTQFNQYNSYSILIFLAWMFIFWILFWKLLLWKEENDNLSIKTDIFVPEIKVTEKITYHNYENDSDITKDSIDIILDEREENYKHKINLKTETLKNQKKEKNVDKMFQSVASNLAKQKKQNLKIIEWIWPKIEKIINNNWIYSYKDLANTEINKLKEILSSANKRYTVLHNPTTWPKQANMANNWNFKELKNYQDKLIKWIEK